MSSAVAYIPMLSPSKRRSTRSTSASLNNSTSSTLSSSRSISSKSPGGVEKSTKNSSLSIQASADGSSHPHAMITSSPKSVKRMPKFTSPSKPSSQLNMISQSVSSSSSTSLSSSSISRNLVKEFEDSQSSVLNTHMVHGAQELDDEGTYTIFSPTFHLMHHEHGEDLAHVSAHLEDLHRVPMNIEVDEEDEEDEDEFDPFLFVRELPPLKEVARPPKMSLPRKLSASRPITLVLDLDETLVHSAVDFLTSPDMTFPVSFGGIDYKVFVRKRPFLENFLEVVSRKFEIIIFTASQRAYADKLLDMIDPDNRYIHYRLFRESCVQVEGNYIKDLSVLGRDLTTTVIVDNSPQAFGYQLDNGIPIESWFDDRNDTELLKLMELMDSIVDFYSAHGDVRPFLRNTFKLYERVEKSGSKRSSW